MFQRFVCCLNNSGNDRAFTSNPSTDKYNAPVRFYDLHPLFDCTETRGVHKKRKCVFERRSSGRALNSSSPELKKRPRSSSNTPRRRDKGENSLALSLLPKAFPIVTIPAKWMDLENPNERPLISKRWRDSRRPIYGSRR